MSSDRQERPESTERLSQQRQLEQQQPVAAKSDEFGEFSLPLVSGSGTRDSGGLTESEGTLIDAVAVRRRWAIPDSVFQRLPTKMEEIAMQGGRNSTNAAKLLLDMHQQNSVDETVGSGGGDVVIFLPDNGRGQ